MRTIILLLTLIALTGCNEHKVDTKAEGEKLMQTSREWSKVAATDSIEKTLSYWADDAVLMDTSGQITGKKAIREMVVGSSKVPGFKISWQPQTVFVTKSGDIGYMIEQTQFTMSDSSGRPMTKLSKVVTIWRKEADGSWKNVAEIRP